MSDDGDGDVSYVKVIHILYLYVDSQMISVTFLLCRAEFRLHLRPDNADLRLTQKAVEAGCASEEREERFNKLRGTVSFGRDCTNVNISQ